MGALCRPSEIRIPNDPAFAPAAGGYVAEVARMIGFKGETLRSIDQGVRTAITALIAYSFGAGDQADLIVSCENMPEGLKVTLRDKGLPFGAAEVSPGGGVCSPGTGSELCSRILGLKEEFDEVRLHSLGPEGKETILIKHMKRGAVGEGQETCDLPRQDEAVPVSERPEWTVRRILPEDAAEISRLVYQTYGYTYPYYDVYYPERIVALNEAGRVLSAVALADGKEIAGHCALQFHEESPRIAELATAFVKPEYRARGCLEALTHYLMRSAEEKGLLGVFTKSVTEHPFSQRSAYRFGLKDCALLVGIIPRHTPFKGMAGPLPYRGSLLLQFRYLRQDSETPCFPPPRHREIIARIYENLGRAPEIRTDRGSAADAGGEAVLKTKAVGPMQFAQIAIERSGVDVVDHVRAELAELRRQRFEIIHLYLDLGDPRTIALTDAFEEIGFFFAGLLPAAFPNGDGLILQVLNTPTVSYEAVVAESVLARELLAYVRTCDPNRPPAG